MQFRGCGTALVTPFTQDGSIDETALRNLVAWQVESGIDFLVPCGTTGETPTLSHDEWLQVIDVTDRSRRRTCADRRRRHLELHPGGRREGQRSRRPARASMRILTASPYYNKPTQEGQYRHFRAIAEASTSRSFSTTFPDAPARIIEPGTLARLAEVPNIAGVKEASGNIVADRRGLQRRAGNFLVFSGDDAITLPVIALGGVGIISVASNEIPREMAEMTRAALNNDWDTARQHSPQISAADAGQLHRVEPDAGESSAGHDGQDRGSLPPALLPMRRDTRSKLQKIATEAGLISKPAAASGGSRGLLCLRKLAGRAAQDRAAPLQLRTMQSRQRTPRGPRCQSRTLAWPLRHALRGPRGAHNMAGVLIRSECKCI